MCIKMLHMFQRIASIPGFKLSEVSEVIHENLAAFEIQVLSTLAIKCQGSFRIFQLASAIHWQKKC